MYFTCLFGYICIKALVTSLYNVCKHAYKMYCPAHLLFVATNMYKYHDDTFMKTPICVYVYVCLLVSRFSVETLSAWMKYGEPYS